MCLSLVDASKALYKLNNNILFRRLKDNNIPLFINIIHFLNY